VKRNCKAVLLVSVHPGETGVISNFDFFEFDSKFEPAISKLP
jgi:hypothetical protein